MQRNRRPIVENVADATPGRGHWAKSCDGEITSRTNCFFSSFHFFFSILCFLLFRVFFFQKKKQQQQNFLVLDYPRLGERRFPIDFVFEIFDWFPPFCFSFFFLVFYVRFSSLYFHFDFVAAPLFVASFV